MQKAQAKEFIKEVLTSKFDKERFTNFVRNLLNDFESKDNSYSGNLIPEAFRDHISHYRRIGKYEDPEGDLMDILIVQTKSVSKLERTRSALRNFVVRHLKTFDKNYALVAFYSKEDDGLDWRLSLVKIDYEINRSEDGRIKVQEDIVPAKRFSFLVGKHENSYTAQKQLLPLLVNDRVSPSIVKIEEEDGSIEAAFGIQKVTDEFYEQYKDLFLKLTEDKNLSKTLHQQGLEPVRFVKKLLGQIVFLYFLQKKGWLGVPRDQKMGEGSKRFIQNRFDSLPEGGNYFNDFLRHLFYEALAKEHHDQGVKYYIEKLDCKIPFLNGGLFEAEYNWENMYLNIPNELFRNDERKGDDKGTGILDVFDRYNFTIKEDEPLEKEVAVDPEMLGKVFENMLEVTERKSKGAFYTPREIVHYMCQESLIYYLDSSINEKPSVYQDSEEEIRYGNKINIKREKELAVAEDSPTTVPKEDLEQFIRHGHLVLENDTTVSAKGRETRDYKYQLSGSVRNNATALDKALASVKVCDPAIGSGAFPVGILHEIVTARKVLVPYLNSSYVSKLQEDSGFKQTENFPSDYYFKRHSIQENIYGADIDSSAIDIARLRLWLSMIVDEEEYETIEALPNLDYKIVCGNSLIGLPENAMRDLDVEQELENLKGEFFIETDQIRKKDLRNKINYKLRELLDSAEVYANYEIDFDFSLYFSEVWHKKRGFDIVIGNPPYISISKFSDEDKELFKKQKFRTLSSRGDIYELFYEKGRNILSKRGHLCYITSNKWLRANYGKSTRSFFLEKTNPKLLFDFGQEMIFNSAIVHSNVLLFQKATFQNEFYGCQMKSGNFDGEKLFDFFQNNAIHLNYFSEEVWAISTPELLKIKKHLEQLGEKIKKWDICISYGIKTGFNEAFILEKEEALNLLKNPKNREKIKKVVRGRDTRRYFSNDSSKYIIISPFRRHQDIISSYPEIYQHLLKYKTKLSNRGQVKNGQHHWLELDNNPSEEYFRLFENEKIIFSEIVSEPQFNLDKFKVYPEATTFFIYGEGLKWLTAFLNSEPITVLFRIFYAGGELVGKYRYKKAFLENLPIPKPIDRYEKPIAVIVDYLTHYKGEFKERSDNRDISIFFERVIDGLVYEVLFKKQFLSANKQILKAIGHLPAVTNEMSIEEKLAHIQLEYERLSHPDHPLKHSLDSLEEIEEVRIIKEVFN